MLEPIQSDLLKGVTHGFFTRRGGVSTGIYAGLNAGHGSRDDTAAVTENRARIASHLGAEHLISIWQVHSADVVTVDGPIARDAAKADGLVTTTPGVALGVLTADCTPVLFADRAAGVVGAAHAGWKGALGGILEAVIEAMEAQGAQRDNILAAVGPVISQRAYEVGPEFVEQFLDDDPDAARFFANGQGDRSMFDLPGFCLSRLRTAGVGDAAWTGHCTYSDEDRFFSYRRACHRGEDDYGRLVAAIRL